MIGGSLEAEVDLNVNDELYAVLSKLEDEIRFVTITSQAKLTKSSEGQSTELEGLSLVIHKAEAEKCERCWHYRADVGAHPEHPTICNRCVENVVGDGEQRHHA
nr:zinc finger domain-containing protein [Kangiella sp. TOML190]